MNFKFLTVFLLSISAFAEVCIEGRAAKFGADNSFIGPHEVCYINVLNEDAGSLAKGSVVVSDPNETLHYEIATSTTAGAVPLCVLMQACANGAKCKCQTYGYNDYVKYDANKHASAGHLAFISESNAGYVWAEVKSSIAASDVPIGTFLESSATSGTIKMFIKLR